MESRTKREEEQLLTEHPVPFLSPLFQRLASSMSCRTACVSPLCTDLLLYDRLRVCVIR